MHYDVGRLSARITLVSTADQVDDSATINPDSSDRYGVMSFAVRY